MTRRGIAYMPATYVAWKRDFIKLFPWQTSRAPISGPVALFLTFVCAVPPSYTKSERQAALDGLVACKVGDADNLAKGVMDALTEIGVGTTISRWTFSPFANAMGSGLKSAFVSKMQLHNGQASATSRLYGN